MKVRLINPRGRSVEVDDTEVELSELLHNGFSYPPKSKEGGKDYNPVYDRGRYVPPAKDNRSEKPGVSGDILNVIRL